jgi:anaerobic magnesium-protoporphyrin IX monomethyl ester cyclase
MSNDKLICLVSVMSIFREATSSVDPPSGILLVGGALKKAGYNVQLFHIPQEDAIKTARKIAKLRPTFVGFSTMTCSKLKEVIEMSKVLKRSKIPVLWGGVHPSLLPEQTLSENYVDYVVIGEGEETIVEFAKELSGKKNFKSVLGLGFKKRKKILVNGRRPLIKNLDNYDPDWSLLNIEDYIHAEPLWGCKKVISMQTSRGCPFRCSFCYNRSFTNSTWRAQSVEHVMGYINWLKTEHGVDGLIINDDNFFVDKKRAIEILEKADVPVWAECSIKFLDDNFIEEISKTKLKSLFLGIESGSQKSLNKMNKMLTPDDTLRVLKGLAKHPKITINGTMIIGIPGETQSEINESMDFALKMAEVHPNMAINIGTYVPYPGTEMYQETIKAGFVPPKNTMEWASFDINDNKNMKLMWLPWADNGTLRKFHLIDKLAVHLNRTDYGNAWQRIAKKVLNKSSRFRLKHRFFFFPLENGRLWLVLFEISEK